MGSPCLGAKFETTRLSSSGLAAHVTPAVWRKGEAIVLRFPPAVGPVTIPSPHPSPLTLTPNPNPDPDPNPHPNPNQVGSVTISGAFHANVLGSSAPSAAPRTQPEPEPEPEPKP